MVFEESSDGSSGSREASRTLQMMHWGLIPSWAKDPSIGSRMINARAETVAEKPSFRDSVPGYILADAVPRRNVYITSWKQEADGKQPYYLRLKEGELFGFAGLWESWRGAEPGGEGVKSATIITTEPNEIAAKVHNRMPVILPPELNDAWLEPDNDDLEELLSMLTPYPAEEMEAYPVSRRVNRPANDEPGVLEPV